MSTDGGARKLRTTAEVCSRVERWFLVAYAAAVVAVPRPIHDPPPFGLYVPTDLRCDGPQPPSQLVRDALFPDDEREDLCGAISTNKTRSRFAWTRHSVFARPKDEWVMVARSAPRLARLVPLPEDRFAIVGEGGALLAIESNEVVETEDDLLARYDIAREDARAARAPMPASPLTCLHEASAGSLHIAYTHHGCPASRLAALDVQFSPWGSSIKGSRIEEARRVTAAERRAFVTTIERALSSDAEAVAVDRIFVEWECDGVRRYLRVSGARAAAIRSAAEAASP